MRQAPTRVMYCEHKAPHWRAVVACALAAGLVGCSSTTARPQAPTRQPSPIGSCADPHRHGAVSDAPQLQRADRDLDRDGTAETVAADRGLCTPEGNCYWNVFVRDPAGACLRFAGTIAGGALETLSSTGDRGFADLRAWWRFAGGERFLMEEYRFRRGGYLAVNSVMCRRGQGSLILCAPADK
jgi:hypothetical protein